MVTAHAAVTVTLPSDAWHARVPDDSELSLWVVMLAWLHHLSANEKPPVHPHRLHRVVCVASSSRHWSDCHALTAKFDNEHDITVALSTGSEQNEKADIHAHIEAITVTAHSVPYVDFAVPIKPLLPFDGAVDEVAGYRIQGLYECTDDALVVLCHGPVAHTAFAKDEPWTQTSDIYTVTTFLLSYWADKCKDASVQLTGVENATIHRILDTRDAFFIACQFKSIDSHTVLVHCQWIDQANGLLVDLTSIALQLTSSVLSGYVGS